MRLLGYGLLCAAALTSTASAAAAGDFTFAPRGRILIDAALVEERFASRDRDFSDSELRAARLGVQGGWGERWRYVAEIDFGDRRTALKDAFVSRSSDGFTLQAGHFKTPNGMEHLTSGVATTFMERGSAPEAFRLGRRLGVAVSGELSGVFLHAGAFGGTVGDHAADFHISDGAALAGRAVYTIGHDARLLHLAVHARFLDAGVDGAETIRFRARPGAHLAERYVVANSTSRRSTLTGVEAAWIYDRFHGLVEHVREDAGAGGSFSVWSVTAGWFLTDDRRAYRMSSRAFDRTRPSSTAGAWEAAVRIDRFDAGAAGRQTAYTAGLNWYARSDARVMLNLVRAEIDGSGARFGPGRADAVQLRVQFDW